MNSKQPFPTGNALQITLILLLSVIVIFLAIITLTLLNSDIHEKPYTQPLLQSDVSDTRSPKISTDESKKAILDEAQNLLDQRKSNNKRIETLLARRNETNRATIDLINAIRDSNLPDALERLESPTIQAGINTISELEDELTDISMENYKLMNQWNVRKNSYPMEIRFSEPVFYKCTISTGWEIEEW